MRALVVYYTHYGNTRRVAERIAEVLGKDGQARAIGLEPLCVADLEQVGLAVFGTPTHYQGVPKTVREVLKALPRRALRDKWVAAFDTSVKMWGPIMWLTAAHGVLGRLRKLGGKSVVPAETFLVRGSEARDQGEVDLLVEGEFERAAAWA